MNEKDIRHALEEIGSLEGLAVRAAEMAALLHAVTKDLREGAVLTRRENYDLCRSADTLYAVTARVRALGAEWAGRVLEDSARYRVDDPPEKEPGARRRPDEEGVGNG